MANMHVALTNRCEESKSPYVRSHMDNATAWQLWNPETIELARKTNRLMLVSIGYSACHWCHVMAHESFANDRIAQLLNENFVPIKLDREERPDIDRQYMDFLQATSGGGGWPLNVFVTPDLHPIFGGTYWAGPQSERLQPGTGFEDVLIKVANMWKEKEQKLRDNGKHIVSQLRDFAQEGTLADATAEDGDEGVEIEVIEDAYEHHKTRYDSKYGGFGAQPKFPTPPHLKALLRFGEHDQVVKDIAGDEEVAHASHMALTTLENIAKGGIKDQVGHGVARYSVTRDWSLPHFEKMLYDNAQLLPLYLDAWLVSKKDIYLDMVHDIATYLTTDPMQSKLGGINASEDADSLETSQDDHKVEGAFYVWSMDDFRQVLDATELKVCTKYWNVKLAGNIEDKYDAEGELVGKNTLCVSYEMPKLAKELGMSEEDVKKTISSGRRKLLEYRDRNRPRPALDDKIVVAWNGLAVGGLARASAALLSTAPKQSAAYLEGANKAARCIKEHLFASDTKTLRRVYREGPGDTPGFADDYAFFISGLLDLYEATFDDQYLEFADTLQQTQIKLFWDEQKYAFFSTPADQPDILVRTKDAMDNAEPSVNGVSAQNLFRLASLLYDEKYEKMAKQTVGAFEVELSQHPGLLTGMLSSLIASKLGMKGLMIVGEGDVAKVALEKARSHVRPNFTVLRVGGEAKCQWLRGRNELLKDLDEKKEMVQLCQGSSCRLLDGKEVENLFLK